MNTISTTSICSYGALRRATRGVGQLYDTAVASAGINAAQYNLICAISELGKPSQSELATHMVMDLSALGHTLKPLLRDGWVDTHKDEVDARVRRIALSPLGKIKLREAQALWKRAQNRFDSLVGCAISKELRELLDRIASPEFAEQFTAEKR